MTVGSASLKWHADPPTHGEGNYWSDTALRSAYPAALSYLDFYNVHYWYIRALYIVRYWYTTLVYPCSALLSLDNEEYLDATSRT